MEKWIESLFICTGITLLSYIVGVRVFQKFSKPWLNPLYTVSVFIICGMSLFHINMKIYTSGTGVFSLLLGTATVSLAVPLYKQIRLIKKYLTVIIWAVFPGTVMGVLSIVLLTKVLHLNKKIMVSLLPKSVTAPIALSISNSLGGAPSLTVLFVFISAIFSLIIGPLLLTHVRIKSGVAKGLALGTSAQAIGANRAFEWGEFEGAMGSIAMIIAGVVMSLLTPLLMILYP